jgi:hypothetical protein
MTQQCVTSIQRARSIHTLDKRPRLLLMGDEAMSRASHLRRATVREWQRLTIAQASTQHRKRAGEHELLSLSHNGNLKSTRGLKRKCSSSGLSRPCLPCPLAIRSVSNNPAGEVTSVRDCTEGSSPITERDTRDQSVRHTDADADSVQGDIPELEMEQQPLPMTLSQGNSPSRIVILKLSLLQAPQIRRDHKRLALALLSGIKTDAQIRNTSKDTFALIDFIFSVCKATFRSAQRRVQLRVFLRNFGLPHSPSRRGLRAFGLLFPLFACKACTRKALMFY